MRSSSVGHRYAGIQKFNTLMNILKRVKTLKTITKTITKTVKTITKKFKK